MNGSSLEAACPQKDIEDKAALPLGAPLDKLLVKEELEELSRRSDERLVMTTVLTSLIMVDEGIFYEWRKLQVWLFFFGQVGG